MNPICVKNFDLNRLKTETTYFVDMCLASGADGCTAEGIFTVIDKISAKNQILRENCVFLKVDNTNNMIGKNNSIASKFSERNNQSQILFFLSECCCDATFQRIQEKFNNPLLKPALLFLSSALPLFTHVNQLLQREEPTIHILQFAIEKKQPNVLSYQLKLERFLVFLKLI